MSPFSLVRVALLPLSFASLTSASWCQSNESEATASVQLSFELLKSPASDHASVPNLVQGADGEHYLSWVEKGSEGEVALKFSRFESEQWGTSRTIIRGKDFFVNWADFPSISVLKDGSIMAHWLRRTGEGYDYNVEFSLSTDAGLTFSEPRLLHDDERPAEHGFVSIAPLNETTFAAIWLDGREMSKVNEVQGDMIIFHRTVSSKGELGNEQAIDSRVCTCCQTSLIATAPGHLLVAYRDRGPKEVRDISVASFDGNTWTKPRTVFDDNWYMPGCPVNGPALATLSNRQAALWFTGAGKGGGRVNFACTKPAATSFGFPIRIDSGAPIGRVDLIACESYYLASWLEHIEGSTGEWRILPMGPAGPLGSPFTLTRIDTARSAGFLRMAPLGQGALVAWTSPDDDSSRVFTGLISGE